MKTLPKITVAKSTLVRKCAQPPSLLDVICKVEPPQSVQDLFEFVEMRPNKVYQCRNNKTGGLTKRVVLTLKEFTILREQLFDRYEQLLDALKASKQDEMCWKKESERWESMYSRQEVNYRRQENASPDDRPRSKPSYLAQFADKVQPPRHKVSGGLPS
jgi:hypothetical protein